VLRLLRPRWIVAILLVAILAGGGGVALARYRQVASALDGAHARLAAVTGAGSLPAVLAPDGGSPLSRATVVLLVPADRSLLAEGVALVRLDPGRGLVSVLAIPAALHVQRPGSGLQMLGAAWADGSISAAVSAVGAYTGVAIDHVAVVSGTGIPSIETVLAGGVATDMTVWQTIALGWVNLRASRRETCHLGGVPTTIGGATFLQASSGNTAALDAFLGVGAAPPAAAGDPLAPGCSPGA
jgi:hypothetical protein